MNTHSDSELSDFFSEHESASTNSLPAEVGPDDAVVASIPRGFAIDCEAHANWLVRKIAAARAYAQRVKTWADQEVRRAQREEAALLFLFGRQIEAWAKAEIGKTKGRRKSVALPAGTVGFRAMPPKLVLDDEAKVIDWAKANLPDAVVVVERLSKTTINDHFQQTGVVPEVGIHLEPGGERFYIR